MGEQSKEFEPGRQIGWSITWATGVVNAIAPNSPALSKGVKKNWRVVKVAGANYNPKTAFEQFDKLLNGKNKYTIVFDTSDAYLSHSSFQNFTNEDVISAEASFQDPE